MTTDNSFDPYGPGKIAGAYKLVISKSFHAADQKGHALELINQTFDETDIHQKEQSISGYRESTIKEDLVTFKIEKNFVLVTLNLPPNTPAFSFATLVFATRYVALHMDDGSAHYVQYLNKDNCDYGPGDERLPHYLTAGCEMAILLHTPELQLLAMPKHIQTKSSTFHEITPELLLQQLFAPNPQSVKQYTDFLTEVSHYFVAGVGASVSLPPFLMFLMGKVHTSYLLKATAFEMHNALNPLPGGSPQAKLYATLAVQDILVMLRGHLGTAKYQELQQVSQNHDKVDMFVLIFMNILALTGYLEPLIVLCIQSREIQTQQVPLAYLMETNVKVVPRGTITTSHYPVVLKPLSGMAIGTTINYVIRLYEVDAYIQQPGEKPVIWREDRRDVERIGVEPSFLPRQSTHSAIANLAAIAAFALSSSGTTAAAEQLPIHPHKKK